MIKELYDYIFDLEIIDTHEHLPPFESMRKTGDVFADFLIHYFSVDLVSSGLKQEQLDELLGDSLSIKEKWDLVESAWERCRYTGYGQSLDLTAKHIYGIEHIDRNTIEALNDAFKAGQKEEHYQKVLKEKSKIKTSILDCSVDEADDDYFTLANRIDYIVRPRGGPDMMLLEEKTDITISSFEDYLEACEIRIDQFSQISNILKCASAYERSINFERVTREEAEKGFNKLFDADKYIHRESQVIQCDDAFSNYIFRYIANVAQKRGMVLQIHTGIQEGNGNILLNSHPLNLNRIFYEFPGLRFDVFHIGYPFYKELGAMCKMFPNVNIDMCWANIISPVACKQALSEWLEFLPYNKISAFGGDYSFIDGVYGHQHLARKNVAEVLSNKVEEGLFPLDKACDIAKALFYDNPAELFGIE